MIGERWDFVKVKNVNFINKTNLAFVRQKGELIMAPLNKALFSSAKEDWETPQDFFEKLDKEFHFDLDPCADAENAKCKEFFTKEQNGLLQDWGGS